MKVELSEVNIVRASDGTFIVRTVTGDGVQEITTAVSFNALTNRLSEILLPVATVEAPSQVQ